MTKARPKTQAPLTCPFCGAAEQERLEMDGKLVLIFPCMFSPVLDQELPDAELRRRLQAFATEGQGYFQRQCDRLHYFVTKGAGAVLPGTADRRGEVTGASGSVPPSEP